MPQVRGGHFVMRSGKSAEQPFNYAVGRYGSVFLTKLRDHKQFIGIRCSKCNYVYVPPRKICRTCFIPMEEFVPLENKGVIATFTILRFPFIDPETGIQRPIPYGLGFIQLEGANSVLQHFIHLEDGKKLIIGASVKAIFQEERQGTLRDIKHFVLI